MRMAKTIAMGSRDQMVRYLKHHCPDGMYAIEGSGIDMTYYRIEGIVYPCGGKQDGLEMPPRGKDECRQVFGTDSGQRKDS
jgi:hypothetical protein